MLGIWPCGDSTLRRPLISRWSWTCWSKWGKKCKLILWKNWGLKCAKHIQILNMLSEIFVRYWGMGPCCVSFLAIHFTQWTDKQTNKQKKPFPLQSRGSLTDLDGAGVHFVCICFRMFGQLGPEYPNWIFMADNAITQGRMGGLISPF